MEKVILNKQRMYGSVRTVLDKYSQVWANVLPFKNSVNAFDQNFDSMEEKELDQMSSKAATKGKNQMLNRMIDNALIVCGGGYA